MNKADEYFIENLKRIFAENNSTEGQIVRPKYKDGTPAHTHFINQVVEKYDISKGEFPIINLRPIYIKKAIGEILWIYQDQTNDLKTLKEKYGINWWDSWDIGDGTIGKRYGYTVGHYNLMNKLLMGLINEPYTRRHIMNMYQYSDFEESEGLYPCAFETIWTVRGKYLDMTLHQRSCDMMVAKSINSTQYVALMMMVARHVGLEPGCFMHVIENLHIYDRHVFNAVNMIFYRKDNIDKTSIPKLVLNPAKENFYSFTVDDFIVEDYNPCQPQLRFELAI